MQQISEITEPIISGLYRQKCQELHTALVALKEAREVLAAIHPAVDVSNAIKRCDEVLADYVIFQPKQEEEYVT